MASHNECTMTVREAYESNLQRNLSLHNSLIIDNNFYVITTWFTIIQNLFIKNIQLQENTKWKLNNQNDEFYKCSFLVLIKVK